MLDWWYLVVGRWEFQYEQGIGLLMFNFGCCMGPISGCGLGGDRYCWIWIVMIGQIMWAGYRGFFQQDAQHHVSYLVGGRLELVGNVVVFLWVGWVGVLCLGGCH